MVEPTLRADELALSAFKQRAAVGTVLPVMQLGILARHVPSVVVASWFFAIFVLDHRVPHSDGRCFSGSQASLINAMPVALTTHTILKGSLSVVKLGMSSDE